MLATVDSSNSYLSIVSTTGQPVTYTGSMANQLGSDHQSRHGAGPGRHTGSNSIWFLGFPGPERSAGHQPADDDLPVIDADQRLLDLQTREPRTDRFGFRQWRSLDGRAAIAESQLRRRIVVAADRRPDQFASRGLRLGQVAGRQFRLVLGRHADDQESAIRSGQHRINAGDTLQTIAANINGNTTLAAAGVQATVATDGTNEWLRIYDQQGKSLQMAESLTSGGAATIEFLDDPDRQCRRDH